MPQKGPGSKSGVSVGHTLSHYLHTRLYVLMRCLSFLHLFLSLSHVFILKNVNAFQKPSLKLAGAVFL